MSQQQCSNCYNGCHDIVSDKCIRYTGVDVEVLGIQTGDSLSFVEQALVTFLVSTLDGTGIKLDIDEDIICELVSQYLPDCEDISALNLFKALIQAACSLQEQIDVIEADYTVDCLSVSADAGTHAVLQAVITKLCEVEGNLETLTTAVAAIALDLDTNYVKLSELNSLIQAYLDSIGTSTLQYLKMIPYTTLPYFGSLSNFDITGAGTGDWEQIYLCNGNNSTPDLRGRVLVGAIQGVGGGAMSAQVDPGSSSFNPNYALNDYIYGNNSITLTDDEIPAHSHPITDVEHTHFSVKTGDFGGAAITASTPIAETDSAGAGDEDYELSGGSDPADIGLTSPAFTGITTTGDNTTTESPHDNKQPTWACYYIIHIPS